MSALACGSRPTSGVVVAHKIAASSCMMHARVAERGAPLQRKLSSRPASPDACRLRAASELPTCWGDREVYPIHPGDVPLRGRFGALYHEIRLDSARSSMELGRDALLTLRGTGPAVPANSKPPTKPRRSSFRGASSKACTSTRKLAVT
jgi:hypothetical protein